LLKAYEHIEQGDRIRPARHGDHHAARAFEQGVPRDVVTEFGEWLHLFAQWPKASHAD